MSRFAQIRGASKDPHLIKGMTRLGALLHNAELLAGEKFSTLHEAKVLIERWRRHYNAVRPHSSHVMAGRVIHADDTPVPALAPGNGKTKTGRLWLYLRDERPHAGPAPPAVLY